MSMPAEAFESGQEQLLGEDWSGLGPEALTHAAVGAVAERFAATPRCGP